MMSWFFVTERWTHSELIMLCYISTLDLNGWEAIGVVVSAIFLHIFVSSFIRAFWSEVVGS